MLILASQDWCIKDVFCSVYHLCAQWHHGRSLDETKYRHCWMLSLIHKCTQVVICILSFPISSQPDMNPGNCWAFKGSEGYLVIQLSGLVKVTAFSMEHIPKTLSPSGSIDSAPREFSIWVSTATVFSTRIGKMLNFPGIWSKFWIFYNKFSDIFVRTRPKWPSKWQVVPQKKGCFIWFWLLVWPF